MVADLVTGQTDWADIVWLIAVILAVLAAVEPVKARSASGSYRWAQTFGWGAVAFVALGLLLL